MVGVTWGQARAFNAWRTQLLATWKREKRRKQRSRRNEAVMPEWTEIEDEEYTNKYAWGNYNAQIGRAHV